MGLPKNPRSFYLVCAALSNLILPLCGFKSSTTQFYFWFENKLHDSWILQSYEDLHLVTCLKMCRISTNCTGLALGPLLGQSDRFKRACYILWGIRQSDCEQDNDCKKEGFQVFHLSKPFETETEAPSSTSTTSLISTSRSSPTTVITITNYINTTDDPITSNSILTTTPQIPTTTTTDYDENSASITPESSSTTTESSSTTTESSSTTTEPSSTTPELSSTTPELSSTTTESSSTITESSSTTTGSSSTTPESSSTTTEPSSTTTESSSTTTESSSTTTESSSTTTESSSTTTENDSTTTLATTSTTDLSKCVETSYFAFQSNCDPEKWKKICDTTDAMVCVERNQQHIYGLMGPDALFTNIKMNAECHNNFPGDIFLMDLRKRIYEPFDETMTCEKNQTITGIDLCYKDGLKKIAIECNTMTSKYKLEDSVEVAGNSQQDPTSALCPDKKAVISLKLERGERGTVNVEMGCAKIIKK